MTAAVNTACDVFISHAIAESDVARQIARGLEAVGLAAFHTGTIPEGKDVGEAIWEALAESRAVIVVISPDTPMQAMGLVEIGAATAWNKPIFLLLNGPPTMKLPEGLPVVLKKYPVYPLNRLDEVIEIIRKSFEPLTKDERDALADVYKDLAISADKLSLSPTGLQDLTAAFNHRTHKFLSGERLLSELLRMRKQGQLPRVQSAKATS